MRFFLPVHVVDAMPRLFGGQDPRTPQSDSSVVKQPSTRPVTDSIEDRLNELLDQPPSAS